MTHSLVTLAFLGAITCTLAACDSSVGGTPNPATSSAVSSSSANQTDTPLAGMSPCKTLDKAVAGQGFLPSAPDTADPEHACTTTKPQAGSAGLVLQDGQTIEQAITDPSATKTGTVHARRAILERGLLGATGGCAVRMEVKPKSRAIVSGTLSTGTTDQACDFARQAAESVESLLPKDN